MFRRLHAIAVLVALALVLGGCDWTMFGFNAALTRSSPDTGISAATVGKLTTAWSATIGGLVTSSPAVADGVVYIGSENDNLYAFKAKGCGASTCQPLWTDVTGGGVSQSPAVANGIVYVGADDGKLYAFNANGCGKSSCTPLWTSAPNSQGFTGSPTLANGLVYVGSGDHNFYAFKGSGCGSTTCAPLWRGTTGGFVDSSPAIVNGIAYIGSNDDKLNAFNANGCGAASCSPLWTAATGGGLEASPAVANGVVFIGSLDHKLYAFAANGCGASTCSPLWVAFTGSYIVSSPAVANGIVYIGSNDERLDSVQREWMWPRCVFAALVFSHRRPIVARGRQWRRVRQRPGRPPLRVHRQRVRCPAWEFMRADRERDDRRLVVARRREWLGLCRQRGRRAARADSTHESITTDSAQQAHDHMFWEAEHDPVPRTRRRSAGHEPGDLRSHRCNLVEVDRDLAGERMRYGGAHGDRSVFDCTNANTLLLARRPPGTSTTTACAAAISVTAPLRWNVATPTTSRAAPLPATGTRTADRDGVAGVCTPIPFGAPSEGAAAANVPHDYLCQ